VGGRRPIRRWAGPEARGSSSTSWVEGTRSFDDALLIRSPRSSTLQILLLFGILGRNASNGARIRGVNCDSMAQYRVTPDFDIALSAKCVLILLHCGEL
jgi:hypothetical protein